MISDANDFECVVMYKKGKNKKEILTHLWSKYQPLVKAVVKNHFKYDQTYLDYEDCIQNCYLCFPQVLAKIKIDKINNKELFSFGSMVKLYLTSYTRSSFKKAMRTYYTTETDYCEMEDGNCTRIHSSYISKDNVEKILETKETERDLKRKLYTFYQGCNERERKLLEICVEKNTAVYKKRMLEYMSMAFSVKKGYTKENQKKEGFSRQYYCFQESRLKRKFISHMRQEGYYSNSSLRSAGLEKLI